MSGIDSLVSKGIADPKRLGVMGWSYGGYLTGSVISQTTRISSGFGRRSCDRLDHVLWPVGRRARGSGDVFWRQSLGCSRKL